MPRENIFLAFSILPGSFQANKKDLLVVDGLKRTEVGGKYRAGLSRVKVQHVTVRIELLQSLFYSSP